MAAALFFTRAAPMPSGAGRIWISRRSARACFTWAICCCWMNWTSPMAVMGPRRRGCWRRLKPPGSRPAWMWSATTVIALPQEYAWRRLRCRTPPARLASNPSTTLWAWLASSAFTGRSTAPIKLESGPLHVLARAGVHLDFFAGLDKKRRLDGDAGFQRDLLLNIIGRIATDALRRIGDFQYHTRGQLD